MIGDAGRSGSDRLISRFGSIGKVLAASPEALRLALGSGHPAIDAILAATRLVKLGLAEQLVGSRVDVGDPLLHDYLRTHLQGQSVERFFAIYLDCSEGYLASEVVSSGSSTQLTINMRLLVHRALDLGAAGLIVAHNHPSGDCRPSELDIRETERLARLLHGLDLRLVDHLIVCQGAPFSLRQGSRL